MITKRGWEIGLLCVVTAVVCSCTAHKVREAQAVAAQADSLWHAGKMYGVDEGDSATLAMAYETMKKHSAFSRQFSEVCPFVHGTSSLCTYSHLCYQYGRLLRAKDDPVAAMRVFIDATHSRTRDYHILGRVYSNMGSICHLANEFPLSYDMYERSANMFLRNGDTINYYYGLNNMAFELTENRDFEKALYLLDSIKNSCKYHSVLSKINETRIILFKHTHQYDSILYYFDSIPSYINNEPLVLISKAQAFCYLHQYDSATHYAKLTLQVSDNLYNLNNAYYILIHCDSINNGQKVYSLSADRADVQKQLEIRQGKMSQAVQLLEQDMARKTDFRWLYSIIVTLGIVGVIVAINVQHKRKKKELLSQQINDLSIQNKAAEEQQAILTRNIDKLSQLHNAHHEKIIADIEQFCKLIQSEQDLQEHLHWRNFAEMCELSNKYFYNIITKLQPYNLSHKEIRLCILVLIKANTNQMINMIPYAQSGLGKFKYTTSNKLGTTTPNLRTFILGLLG